MSGAESTILDMDFALTRAVDIYAARTPFEQNFHALPPDELDWMDTLPEYARRYLAHLQAETGCEICREVERGAKNA